MPDPAEPYEAPVPSGSTDVVAHRPAYSVVGAELAEQTRLALDMIAFGSRKVAKYELLLSRIVNEIGRFAVAARRERAQLEDEVKMLRQEVAALRKEQAATEQSLVASQLDCWALRMRVQAMKDAREMFDGLRDEPRRGPPDAHIEELD